MKLILALCGCVAVAWGQAAANANSGYKTPEGRARVGKTLAASDRDGRQKPQELVNALEIKPGSTVVDLGTGVGYMLPYLSKAAGPDGKVFAQDIFEDFLSQAKETAAKHSLKNVEFIHGSDQDPKLPAGAVDLVMTLDAYHHFDYPDKMLASIARSLRDGGRLAIVDFYKTGFRDPAHIRLDQADLIKEVEANGFRLIRKQDHMPNTQYIAIFVKK
ncbi:MAG TPA: methyltransferase domain-containing protein [Bryobacteraceae bacterium]|nr:methyltransferase domain-containing protein [Bryobacteraceae bacterium]